MSDLSIVVTGFVANELEVRQAGQHRVVEVTVPHTPRKFDKGSSQWVDAGDTVWLVATFWNDHADSVINHIGKGDVVTVSGSLEVESYMKRDGTPGARVKVSNPQIARVVRKPRRDGGSNDGQGDAQWGQGDAISGSGHTDTSSTPQGGTQPNGSSGPVVDAFDSNDTPF